MDDEGGRGAHHVGTAQNLRASIASDLGVASVPFALRISVGFEYDDTHRYVQPDADYACWGWMVKKGGIRKHWQERFVELDAHGVLRYYTECTDKPIKHGGSTKSLQCGYDQKGQICMADAEEIRMSTAPGAKAGEIEIVVPTRTYRMTPGRSTPGHKNIPDKLKAGQIWCMCLNMARVAALGEAAGMDATGPELRASVKAASSRDLTAASEGAGSELERAVTATRKSARDLSTLA